MRKQPVRLTVSVPHGNAGSEALDERESYEVAKDAAQRRARRDDGEQAPVNHVER